MGSIGLSEIVVVVVVALLVLGPNRLPDAARSVGKAVAEFRRVTAGLQAEVRDTFGDITGPLTADVTHHDPPPTVVQARSPLLGTVTPLDTADAGDVLPPPETTTVRGVVGGPAGAADGISFS